MNNNAKIIISILGTALVAVIIFFVFLQEDKIVVIEEQPLLNTEESLENENNDFCLNIEGIQTSIPEGMENTPEGKCVVKKTTSYKQTTSEVITKPAIANEEPVEDASHEPTPAELIAANWAWDSEGRLDTSNYRNIVTVESYDKNPNPYLYKGVRLTKATITSFNSGSSDYIHVIDKDDNSSDPVSLALLVSDGYTEIVENLPEWNDVVVFGVGLPAREFNILGENSSHKEYRKVILIDAIYTCSGGCINVSPNQKIWERENS